MRVHSSGFAHPLSWTTTRIRTFFNSVELGSGTGFVIDFAGRYALVTNWHVLSGRHAVTEQCLDYRGATPNRIEFHLNVFTTFTHEGLKAEQFDLRPISIPLYRNDEPIWFDSRSIDSLDDFAIIPIDNIETVDLSDGQRIKSISGGNALVNGYMNDEGQFISEYVSFTNFNPQIGSDVFVLGYPRGLELTGVLPVWKRASIATEPQCPIVINDRPKDNLFYIDGNTKPGMSGSPVIYFPKPEEPIFTDDGTRLPAVRREPILLGVYAGRDGVTKDEHELSLGRVWKTLSIQRLFQVFLGMIKT